MSGLIQNSNYQPDIVVAVGRGGYLPARLVCDALDIMARISIKIEHYMSGSDKQDETIIRYPLCVDIKDLCVLIVDDVNDSGDTLQLATEHILSFQPQEVRTAVMVSLETIGYFQDFSGSQSYPPVIKWFYPDRGNFIAFVSSLRSRKIMHQSADVFRQRSSFPLQTIATFSWIPGVCWSDHLSFWRNGYRAFMITDTALYRYPYHHTVQDTPDKIHYQSLAGLTESLFKTFEVLAR